MEFINGFLNGILAVPLNIVNNKEFGFALGVAVALSIIIFIFVRFMIWLHERR